MKSVAMKRIAYTLISVIVLLLLFTGAGAAYIWYSGQQEPEINTATTTPAEPKSVTLLKPTKPSPNTPPSAAVRQLTSPVAPGANASIQVKTVPTSNCVISVVYDKTASKDSGLSPKTADEFGLVSWTWTVDANAPIGKWPVKVTCEYNKKTAVVIGDLVVDRSAQPPQ